MRKSRVNSIKDTVREACMKRGIKKGIRRIERNAIRAYNRMPWTEKHLFKVV